MPRKTKIQRNAAAGRFTVRSEGKDARSNEKWAITENRGGSKRVVVTSRSSAAAIDKIMVRHAKALKRLADK